MSRVYGSGRGPASLYFRSTGMLLLEQCVFFQCLVNVMLSKSALVTLALAIDFGHGGASDAKYTLFSAGDTEHPVFS